MLIGSVTVYLLLTVAIGLWGGAARAQFRDYVSVGAACRST